MGRTTNFLAIIWFSSSLITCTSAASTTKATHPQSHSSQASAVSARVEVDPQTPEVAECEVVVAMTCQGEQTWTQEQVHELIEGALDGKVSPWQDTLVTPMLPQFGDEAVVVVVYTLGVAGDQEDHEFAPMKGYAVRVDLHTGMASVNDWGVPMAGKRPYERVILVPFSEVRERQARSDQALLDLMSGAQSEEHLRRVHAFTDAADWFDRYPVYRTHLASKMEGSVHWLESARGGQLAR